MYRPSQTPRLTLSPEGVVPERQGPALERQKREACAPLPASLNKQRNDKSSGISIALKAPTYATPLMSLHESD